MILFVKKCLIVIVFHIRGLRQGNLPAVKGELCRGGDVLVYKQGPALGILRIDEGGI